MKRFRKCVYKPETVAAPAKRLSLRERLVQMFRGRTDGHRGYAHMPASYDKSDVVFDDCL